MFLQSCQPATSTSSSSLVITFPPFSMPGSIIILAVTPLSLPPFPLSHCFFFPFLGITLNRYLWKEGGRLLLVQDLPRTLSSKKPLWPCSGPEPIRSSRCLFLKKLWPWYASRAGVCRQADCTLRPTCLSWLKKNAEGKITCLAPDGINNLYIYTHTHTHTNMFITFLLKSVCLSNIFINVIWSVLETFWNMCKCNKATRPGGKIRWIF